MAKKKLPQTLAMVPLIDEDDGGGDDNRRAHSSDESEPRPIRVIYPSKPILGSQSAYVERPPRLPLQSQSEAEAEAEPEIEAKVGNKKSEAYMPFKRKFSLEDDAVILKKMAEYASHNKEFCKLGKKVRGVVENEMKKKKKKKKSLSKDAAVSTSDEKVSLERGFPLLNAVVASTRNDLAMNTLKACGEEDLMMWEGKLKRQKICEMKIMNEIARFITKSAENSLG